MVATVIEARIDRSWCDCEGVENVGHTNAGGKGGFTKGKMNLANQAYTVVAPATKFSAGIGD
jgi:hypothetical protein